MEPIQIVDDRFNRLAVPDVWSPFDMNESLSDLHLAQFSYGTIDSPSMQPRKRQRTEIQQVWVPYHPYQAETSTCRASTPEMNLTPQYSRLYNWHRTTSPIEIQNCFGYNTYPSVDTSSQSHKRTYSQSKSDRSPTLPVMPIVAITNIAPVLVPKPRHPPVVVKLPATAPGPQNVFKLTAQPHEKQRKAYQNEKRHLLPHPLTVAYTGNHEEEILQGEISVRILAVKGITGNNQLQTEAMEEGCLGGHTTLKLSKRSNYQAAFSLNVFKTTGAKKYVLEFTVNYDTYRGHFEEKILSRPFAVSSNRVKPDIERPVIAGLNPSVYHVNGPHCQIWIRGKKFMKFKDNLIVKFGDKVADIEECEGNLLVVTVPQLALAQNHQARTVPVTVTNVLHDQSITCKDPLMFTYLPFNSHY